MCHCAMAAALADSNGPRMSAIAVDRESPLGYHNTAICAEDLPGKTLVGQGAPNAIGTSRPAPRRGPTSHENTLQAESNGVIGEMDSHADRERSPLG